MKLSIRDLRALIVETLLLESECPLCSDKEAYVGMNDVECPNPKCTAYSERQASDVGRLNRKITFSGRIDFNVPTAKITEQVVQFLQQKGYTKIHAKERWENDGVFEIWSDEGQKNSKQHSGKVGWSLEVSGSDLTSFTPSMGFRYDVDVNKLIINQDVSSWEQLSELLDKAQSDLDQLPP